MQTIPYNVKDFVNQCASIAAHDTYKNFVATVTDSIRECESPIEQLFETALRLVLQITENEAEFYHNGKEYVHSGVYWSSQYQVENYRADYFMSVNRINSINIIVELDGHRFHEMSEKQRRYEKKRDRFFQKRGFRVFRFTGAEVVANPFKPVIECVSFLLDQPESDFYSLLTENGYTR